MKKIIFPILLTASILLTACGPKTQPKQNQGSQTPNQQQEKFSLKNALTAGQSLRCNYEMNGDQITTLIKGNKYKIDGMGSMGEANNGGMVSDGTFMYMWDDETKKGTKYDIKVVQEMGKDSQEETENNDYSQFDFQEWAETQEGKYKIDCQPVVLTDAEFTPPSDVTFQDLTQTMIQLNEMSKKMQANPNQMPNSEDLEKMGELFKGMGAGTGENPQSEETPTEE